jgi:hypothetical protein
MLGFAKDCPDRLRAAAQYLERTMSGGHNPIYVEKLQETPREIKKREARNKARYDMEKAGKVHKGDGVDVDHRQPLASGGSNAASNWRVRSRHANRAEGDLDAKKRPI